MRNWLTPYLMVCVFLVASFAVGWTREGTSTVNVEPTVRVLDPFTLQIGNTKVHLSNLQAMQNRNAAGVEINQITIYPSMRSSPTCNAQTEKMIGLNAVGDPICVGEGTSYNP